MRDDWMREHKVVILLRFLRTLVPRLDPTVPYAGDLLTNDRDAKCAGRRCRPLCRAIASIADRVAP